jgi:hypothetical protein
LCDGLLDEGRFDPARIAERWQRTSVTPSPDKRVRPRRCCVVANMRVRKCKRSKNRTSLSGCAAKAANRTLPSPHIQDGTRGVRGRVFGDGFGAVKSRLGYGVEIILCWCDSSANSCSVVRFRPSYPCGPNLQLV